MEIAILMLWLAYVLQYTEFPGIQFIQFNFQVFEILLAADCRLPTENNQIQPIEIMESKPLNRVKEDL